MGINIEDLRKLCIDGAIRWTAHVMQRLIQRGITRAEVIQAIIAGEIIEQYPNDYPFPSCLIFAKGKRPLHIVCGQ